MPYQAGVTLMDTANPNAAKPKARRRWYQYSLRTLLIFVTLAGCGFGCNDPSNYAPRALVGDAAKSELASEDPSRTFAGVLRLYYLCVGGLGGSTTYISFDYDTEDHCWDLLRGPCPEIPRESMGLWSYRGHSFIEKGPAYLGSTYQTELWDLSRARNGSAMETGQSGGDSFFFIGLDEDRKRAYVCRWFGTVPAD